MKTLTEIHSYYKARIEEVKKYSTNGDPWAFLMAASYIDYLVRIVYNIEPTTHKEYKQFIRDYLSLVNPKYKDFAYESGNQDLPEQMYHVLRCGIIHGYSLVPDEKSRNHGGRVRSILLAHKKNGETHLNKYNKNNFDSVVFTAENFTEDLEKVLDKIFVDIAPQDSNLSNNIVNWVTKYPPIMSVPTA